MEKLNLVSGFIDAFGIFFAAYHMSWFIPIIAVLIIVGSLGGASAWILGPARGLLVATEDNKLPAFMSIKNSKDMPGGILILQGIIVTVLCGVFFIMPNVNSSYWILSNLTAQLALLFYILMFAAAIRLRYKHAHVKRAYYIPGGKIGLWVICGVGILTCASAIMLGFLPPTQVKIGSIFKYEAILTIGILLCCVIPLFLRSKKP